MHHVSTDVKYVWLDEDDEIMSPVHTSLGAALGFAGDWPKRWKQAQARVERAREEADRYQDMYREDRYEKAKDGLAKLSKTGKPPHKLMHYVTEVRLVNLKDAESSAAQLVVGR